MMGKLNRYAATAAAIVYVTNAGAASASAASTTQIGATVQSQDFDKSLGSLRSIELLMSRKSENTTVEVRPIVARREVGGLRDTAVGGGVDIYHDWSAGVSTRTYLFVAENKIPLAHFAVAQDITGKVADRTTITVGARYSRYFGGTDVVFVSAGARRYFAGGSVAYTAIWTKPDAVKGYVSHLVSVTLKDGRGDGKTQLWASYGSASLTSGQFQDTFRGHDYGVTLQRVQPVGGALSLTMRLGAASYDRATGRVTATTAGLGLRVAL